MTARLVYFDLASGAGGDMLIAALVDAGRRIGSDAATPVAGAIDSLGLGCTVDFDGVDRGGLASLHCRVSTDDRSYTPARLRDAIATAAATKEARHRATAAIDVLIGAEAAVHGVGVDEVHLHELGSADTAADTLGAAVAFEAHRVDTVTAAPVPVPRGWIESGHGRLPVPAPATLEILRGAEIVGVASSSELVTPTAAAILVAHDCVFGHLPAMTLAAVGVGAGTADLAVPNICRAFIGDRAAVDGATQHVVQLDTNIDDQTPEALGYAIDRLLEAGAVDAWITPIVMKKSRPAFALSVLVHAHDEKAVLEVLFRETTTLGVRRRATERWVAERDEIVVTAAGECVRVKVAYFEGERVGATPEFEDCVRASRATGVSLKDVYADAAAAAQRALAAETERSGKPTAHI